MKLVNTSQEALVFPGHGLWSPGEERDLPQERAEELLLNVNIAKVEEPVTEPVAEAAVPSDVQGL